jgi:hypothetical protein
MKREKILLPCRTTTLTLRRKQERPATASDNDEENPWESDGARYLQGF